MSRAQTHAPRRASILPRPHTHYMTDRTGIAPAVPGLSTDGTRRLAPIAHGHRSIQRLGHPAVTHLARSRPSSARPSRPARRLDRAREIGFEIFERTGRGRRKCPNHHVRTSGEIGELRSHQVSQPTSHLITDNRAADGLGNHKSGTRRRWNFVVDACRIVCVFSCLGSHVDHKTSTGGTPASLDRRSELVATSQAGGCGQHQRPRQTLGRETVATLGPTGREDRATGAGAHAQPEAVGLRTPAVVRLIGALAHVRHSVFVCSPEEIRQII